MSRLFAWVAFLALLSPGLALAQASRGETERLLSADIRTIEFYQYPAVRGRDVTQTHIQELFDISISGCNFQFDGKNNATLAAALQRHIKLKDFYVNFAEQFSNTLQVHGPDAIAVIGDRYFVATRGHPHGPQPYHSVTIRGSDRFAATFQHYTASWCRGKIRR